MKKHLKLLILLFSCFVAISCEKEITIKNVNFTPVPVLYSILNTDTVVTLNLSETQYILDKDSAKWITNAQISLYENDGLVPAVFNYSSNGNFISNYNPSPNKKYEYIVRIGTKEISAIQYSLPKPILQSWDTSTITYRNNSDFFEIKLQLSDTTLSNNFYSVTNYALVKTFQFDSITNLKIDSTIEWKYLTLTGNDIIFTNNIRNNTIGNELLFNDALFNGRIRNIAFGCENLRKNKNKAIVLKMIVTINHISKEYKEYREGIENHLLYKNDPFAQINNVPSNIKGGYGLFGSSSSKSIIFEFN